MTFGTKLPVAIELDRYLIEVRQLIEQKNFKEANTWLNKAKNLNIALPPDFHFLNSQYQFSAKQYANAESSIIEYLNYTGRLGRDYNAALSTVTALEKELLSTAKTREKATNKKHQINKPITFPKINVNKIITRTDKKTAPISRKPYRELQNSINKLLNDNAIFERYGVKIPTLLYSVNADYNGMIVITRTEEGMEGLQIASHNLTIQDIPKKLDSECSWQEQRCWINHPVKNKRWLEISYKEEINKTLLASMEELINTMRN